MKVDIHLKVTLETPVNVGSGALADALADKPTLRDARGLPIIPGSTLKGKVRHVCEQIAHRLWDDQVCHAPYPDQMCRGAPSDGVCRVCRIFGSPWYRSPLRFDDLHLEPDRPLPAEVRWQESPNLQEGLLRTGVGLSRRSGTAQEEILYSVEGYSPPAAFVYAGRITGRLANEDELGLLLAGLREVRALGGSKGRGMGWCCIKPTVTVDGQRRDVEELLKVVAQWSQ
jgi:CRISPR/Cas system CSM-associated protein Csm3 (group 7 of RAMP superfamily)